MDERKIFKTGAGTIFRFADGGSGSRTEVPIPGECG